MPRIPVNASPSITTDESETPALDSETLTDRQTEIIRLRFIEGMAMFKIAQVLRVNPKTVKRDLTAALAILQQTEEDVRGEIQQREGQVQMKITVAFGGGHAVTLTDSTLVTTSKIMTIPGLRSTFFMPAGNTPDVVRAIQDLYAQREQGGKKKRRKQAA